MPRFSPDRSNPKGGHDPPPSSSAVRDGLQSPNKISIEIAEDPEGTSAAFLEALIYIRGRPCISDVFVRAEDESRGCSYTDLSDLTSRDLPAINEWIHEMEEDAKSLNVRFVIKAEVTEWLERLLRSSR